MTSALSRIGAVLFAAHFALVLASPAFAATAAPLVYLAGDSTMAQKPLDLPERGWGMALAGFMKDPAMVQNHAVNGRSTKSFLSEGRWARLIGAVRPGDFVLIEFGHNDEKIDRKDVGTDADTEFRSNLRRFVRDVREKGAFPILATPIARRRFDASGRPVPTHGKYPQVVREVAANQRVPLLDLEKATTEWLRSEGPERSKRYFKEDNTHLVDAGAVKVASLAAQLMRSGKLALAKWLK